jgi:hypothetical protein
MMPDGFAALAKLMQAPVGDVFPFPWMCNTILMIIKNAHATVEDLTLKQAKMLGMVDLLDGYFLYRLEPTGLLAQALRALTSPLPVSEYFPAEHLLQFVNVLIRDTKFIWKRCRPGTPLNNTLKALLDGTDGWEPHAYGSSTETNPDLPLVKRRLQMLYDKSLLDKASLEDTGHVSCRKCHTTTSCSMKCGRCKGAMYCSRYVYDMLRCVTWTCIHASFLKIHHTAEQTHPLSFSISVYLPSLSIAGFIHSFDLYVLQSFSFTSACQKADWSQHKKMCRRRNVFPAFPLAKVVNDWLSENLLEIVQETQLLANRLGISRRDVILEVDLKSSSYPAILVKPLKVYMDGSAIPDWGSFVKAETLMEGLKDAHSRMTDQDILVLHRSYDADYGIVRFSFSSQ